MALAPLAVGLALLAHGQGGPIPQNQIVLARSIGPVILGQRRSAAEKAVGTGTVTSISTNDLGRFVRVRYQPWRLVVTYRSVGGGSPVAVTVATSSTRYRTSKGIHVGLRQGPVRRAYPAVNCHVKRLCRLGLPLPGRRITAFRMDEGRVATIEVASVVD